MKKGRKADDPSFAIKLAKAVLKLPLVPNAVVGLVKLLDRYGLAPKALLDELPFHTSMYVTNMASIGMTRVYHHIYNFGNTSLFFSMGTPQRSNQPDMKGEISRKCILPIGITADRARVQRRDLRQTLCRDEALSDQPYDWNSRRRRSTTMRAASSMNQSPARLPRRKRQARPHENGADHRGKPGYWRSLRAGLPAGGLADGVLLPSEPGSCRSTGPGNGAIALQCDVADSEAVRRAVQETKAFLPHVDALVNNAGIASQELLTDVTDEQWRRMVDTNLSGAFYLCPGRAAGDDLPAGRLHRECFQHLGPHRGQLRGALFRRQGGLIGLTRGLAKEVGPSGVRVNCVCPGVIRTDMLSTFTPDDLAELARRDPFGPSGHPGGRGPGRAVAFRPESAFITGQVLGVDGGFPA